MRNTELHRHYRDAIDFIDSNFPRYFSYVLNMGKPRWDVSIPTAGIAIDARTQNPSFLYVFNLDFAIKLSTEEFAFVMMHETMHMLMSHHKQFSLLIKRGYSVEKLNVAADLIVNDTLLGFGLSPEPLMSILPTGMKILKHDCSRLTLRVVYNEIEDNDQQHSIQTGNHQWLSEEMLDSLSKALEAITPSTYLNRYLSEEGEKKSAPPGASSEAGHLKQFMDHNKKVSMNWARLLAKVNPDIFSTGRKSQRRTWRAKSRKIHGIIDIHPELNVPASSLLLSYKGDIPAIAMFLDGSGSCAGWIDEFVTLAKSVPQDSIHLFCYSFSTYTQPLNLKERSPALASGGTAFSPIERVINDEILPRIGHYPKAVVIMSDGIGNFSNQRPDACYEDNWLWLLRGKSPRNNRPGTDLNLDDFVKL